MQKRNYLFDAALTLALLLLVLIGLAFAQEGKTVKEVRDKYPTPLGATHGAFLIEVACALDKGLLRKDWGTFVRLPDGTGVSQDILMDRDGKHYDILGDGENTATPGWGLVVVEGTNRPLLVEPQRYYKPRCVDPESAAIIKDQKVQLAALQASLDAMTDARNVALSERDEARTTASRMKAELDALKAKPAPTCRAHINLGAFKIPIPCSIQP